MRLKIAAGNWKMNTDAESAVSLATALKQEGSPNGVITVLCVPSVFIDKVQQVVADSTTEIYVAAQNVHQAASGAYTGEISVGMLASLGVKFVVLGHSERREYFHETDDLLLAKTKTVIAANMKAIFCCGEPLSIRKADTHVAYVLKQLHESIFQLSAEDFASIIIAYEPIWAIGTGETASPEQAQEMHAAIREAIAEVYGNEVADATSILYGGSVKASNAKEIFAKTDVDGGLVGGASLSAPEFIQIMNAF